MPEEDPALPPDPALINRQPKWFKKVYYGLILASILFAIALMGLMFAPMFIRVNRTADQTEAISNARQIGFSLFEFETEYGVFPSESTVGLVAKSHPAHGYDFTGKSSNAMFRQLIAAELTLSERMFYAKVMNSRIPDLDILPGKALENGEVGFAYIFGLSSKDNPNTPIVLAPMIPGTTKFDPKGFGGRGNAVVLFIDNSVRSYKIEKDGHIYDKGIDLLSSKHPIWKGKKPDIRYPE